MVLIDVVVEAERELLRDLLKRREPSLDGRAVLVEGRAGFLEGRAAFEGKPSHFELTFGTWSGSFRDEIPPTTTALPLTLASFFCCSAYCAQASREGSLTANMFIKEDPFLSFL